MLGFSMDLGFYKRISLLGSQADATSRYGNQAAHSLTYYTFPQPSLKKHIQASPVFWSSIRHLSTVQ